MRNTLFVALLAALAPLSGCLGDTPGLALTVNASPRELSQGALLVVLGEVTNEGEQPVAFADGPCNPAWRFEMKTLEGVPIRVAPEDVPACAAPEAEAVLAPGEARSASFTWNGTFWDGTTYHPVPYGDYRAWVTFEYRAPGTDEPLEVAGFAVVIVLAT